MMIEVKYQFGQVLYLKTDQDQKPRILTGVLQRSGGVQLELACGSGSSWHWLFEISDEKDVLTKMLNTTAE